MHPREVSLSLRGRFPGSSVDRLEPADKGLVSSPGNTSPVDKGGTYEKPVSVGRLSAIRHSPRCTPGRGEPIEAPYDRLRHIKLVAYYRVARDELGIHVNPRNQTSNPSPLLLVYLLQPALASDGVTWS